jgi:hypothetical protein
MASRTATSALPWHQYSAAADEALDVDRRAGVVGTALLERGAENTRPGTGTGSRSALALRHRGTRKRRYLSRILRVASSGLLAPPAPGRREAELITDAGVLCAVWNAAGDEHAEDASAYDEPPTTSRARPSQGRRRLSSEKITRPALLASSGEQHAAPAGGCRPKWNPSSSDVVHRIENSSSGSMSMKDAVELLKDSPRVASTTSRRSNDRGLHLGHPPREKLSLRDGEGASMEREREQAHGTARRAREALVRACRQACEPRRDEARRAASEWGDEDDIGAGGRVGDRSGGARAGE